MYDVTCASALESINSLMTRLCSERVNNFHDINHLLNHIDMSDHSVLCRYRYCICVFVMWIIPL